MKNLKWILLVAFIVILIPIAILAYLSKDLIATYIPSSEQATIVGQLTTKPNKELSDNINSYYGKKNNWECAHILFGYDDKYAYTWSFCSKYVYREYGGVEEDSGQSLPVRFEYDKNTLEIKGYKEPGDGSEYDRTTRMLFPFEIYTKLQLNTSDYNKSATNLSNEVKQRFINSLDSKLLSVTETVSAKYPEMKNWIFSPTYEAKGFGFKVQNGSYYLAYFSGIGGNSAADPKCFEVKADNQIVEIKPSNIDSTTKAIDPVSCKGISSSFLLDRNLGSTR